jgi:ketosteroid isomerase-like protein
MCTVAFLAAAILLGARAPAPVPGSTESEVVDSERAWSRAFLAHDLAALSRLLADDFVGIDGRGVVSDKAAELEEAKAPAPGSTQPVLVGEQLSDARVRIYGDVAVLTAVNTARFSDSTVQYRRTTVWVRRGDRWQCVSFHGSRIL